MVSGNFGFAMIDSPVNTITLPESASYASKGSASPGHRQTRVPQYESVVSNQTKRPVSLARAPFSYKQLSETQVLLQVPVPGFYRPPLSVESHRFRLGQSEVVGDKILDMPVTPGNEKRCFSEFGQGDYASGCFHSPLSGETNAAILPPPLCQVAYRSLAPLQKNDAVTFDSRHIAPAQVGNLFEHLPAGVPGVKQGGKSSGYATGVLYYFKRQVNLAFELFARATALRTVAFCGKSQNDLSEPNDRGDNALSFDYSPGAVVEAGALDTGAVSVNRRVVYDEERVFARRSGGLCDLRLDGRENLFFAAGGIGEKMVKGVYAAVVVIFGDTFYGAEAYCHDKSYAVNGERLANPLRKSAKEFCQLSRKSVRGNEFSHGLLPPEGDWTSTSSAKDRYIFRTFLC